ncbi:TOBE domain-containing protein [Aestuariivirga sp.]|uniref:TOBE domain-containing protein n=1 Tax=Aestuariivirga sp. TaxID=2650926 RepID=UPI0039E473C1
MGDVNVIPVTVGKGGRLQMNENGRELKPPRLPEGFESGYLVVRPEYIRFLDKRSDADNAVEGKLYNEYALGSRIQYQVRVGDAVFVVEKLRQQPFAGKLDDTVIIGWDAKDGIVVTD